MSSQNICDATGRWLCWVNSHTIILFSRGGIREDGQRVQPPHNSKIALLGAIHQNSLSEKSYVVQSFSTKDTQSIIYFDTCYDSENKFMFLMLLGNLFSENKNISQSSLFGEHEARCILNAIYGLVELLLGKLTFDVMHNRQVEQFKKKLWSCGNVIDRVLSVKCDVKIHLLVSLPRRTLCNPQRLQLRDAAYLQLIRSNGKWGNNFGSAILVNKSVYIASDEWLSHSKKEMCILGYYLGLLTTSTARDIPIFLKNVNKCSYF